MERYAFFGASDLEAKIGGSGELEFMRLLLDGPEQLKLYSFVGYDQSAAGLGASLGRDEYRVLWPLATEHHGSSYEGWATKRVAQEWTQDDVLLTLAYSTLPFPPGLSICCQDTTGSWPQFWIDEERMRVEGDDWIEKCLITLRVIVIGAFDNERLLFWVPDTEIGVSAGALAIRSGLTPIDDQLCGEQRVAELKHCGPIDFADERVVAVRVRFRGWD